MNQLLLMLIVLVLSGCVGTATVVSCAANSDQLPEKESYALNITAKISSESGEFSKTIPMQCIYKERRCGGGDWYFKWNEVRDQELSFDLSQSKSLSIDVPNCTMALDYLGKNYPYGNSSITSNGQKFTIANQEMSQPAAKSVLGAQLISLKVSEAESE